MRKISFFPPSLLFFLWITLLLVIFCSGFLILANGLHLDHFSLAGVTADDVTLTWQSGLNLEIDSLQIDAPEKKDSEKLTGMQIQRALKTFQLLRKIVPSISVHSLDYNEYKIQILSQKKKPSHPFALTLDSEDLHLEAFLTWEQDDARIDLQNLSSKQFNSSTSGTFLVKAKTLQVRGELTANLADCLPIQLSIVADLDKISFQGQGYGESTTIKPLVDLFGLSHNIQPWITDYLTGSRYHLQAISGTIPWQDPAAILDTLSASVRVDDCAYTFAQGLEPIKTKYAEVTFSRGVLNIIPYDSSFYGQEGKKSRLDINFNDPNSILLTAYIKTRARANGDIVNLLAYYNIHLPFLQTAGTTATDLTLAINLNTERVQAFGTFEVGKSMFTYEGTPYQVTGGRVELKGTDIMLDGLNIGLEKLFKARISGRITPQDARTDLKIEVQDVQIPLKDSMLALDQAKPLHLSYHSRPQSNSITVAPSRWLLGKTALHLDSFSAPFDFKQLSGKLPSMHLVIPSMAELSIVGNFNLKKQQADLQLNLHQLQTQSLALNQDALALTVHCDGQLNITTSDPSSWLVAGMDITLSPFDLSYSNDLLRLENMQISSVDLFDTLVKGNYDLSKKQGQFDLKELLFARKNTAPFLKFPNELSMNLEVNAGTTRVQIDTLGLSLRSEKSGGLDVDISDMGKLLDRSPLLRRLKVSSGTFHLATTSPSSPLQFTGRISSSYALLVQNDLPQSDYIISGGYGETGLNLVINQDFHVRYDGTITINSKNIGYNVPAILHFNKDRPKEDKPHNRKKDAPDIVLQAEDGFLLFSKGSRILADTMTLTVRGNRRDLNITHGPGEIIIKVIDDSFTLQGYKLNDQFMNALIMDAYFEDGYLTAFAEGTFDRFTAAFSTDKILLKDYATLNNILAVINTLPALITFSLPNYDRDGWPVDSIHMWFNYNQGIATVKSLELNSPEMDMRGTGAIDPLNQQVNLDINMITRAGQNMSKIPVVGYILAGEEELPTLTFHVTGDLLDPEVESTVFEEIITSPFDMVLRTLTTPFKWAVELFEQDQAYDQIPAESIDK